MASEPLQDGYAIRDLAIADLDALLELYGHLHEADAALPARAQVEATWEHLCASEDHVYLAIEFESLLVASCTATIIPNLTRGARPYGVVENVITHPDHRRRGLGHAVITATLERCWARQCYKVMLTSGQPPENVDAFYEGLGFDKNAKRAFIARPPARRRKPRE